MASAGTGGSSRSFGGAIGLTLSDSPSPSVLVQRPEFESQTIVGFLSSGKIIWFLGLSEKRPKMPPNQLLCFDPAAPDILPLAILFKLELLLVPGISVVLELLLVRDLAGTDEGVGTEADVAVVFPPPPKDE